MNSYQDYKMAKIKRQEFQQQKSACLPHYVRASNMLAMRDAKVNQTKSLP